MPTLGTDSWGRVRQSFADQFEPYGKDLIYRRFQNGKGIKVTSAERECFVESFDKHLVRARRIIGLALHWSPTEGLVMPG